MISDNSFKSYGQTETTSEDTSVKAVVEFLDTHLPDFPSDFTKRVSTPDKEKENSISQALEIFLRRRRKDEFFDFKGQWDFAGRIPDFGVYEVVDRNPFGLPQAFFIIEAKILPTGSKDYIKGNYGGIERFKRNLHGKDLPQSAMIGYVQKETCSHWHTKINEWINELISNNSDTTIFWDSEDLLIETNDFHTTKKYFSQNTRIVDSNRDKIILYHYLMELVA